MNEMNLLRNFFKYFWLVNQAKIVDYNCLCLIKTEKLENFRFKNGNVYEGHWVNNIRQGEGTMRWYDLGQEYTGQWQNGLQNGQGENTWFVYIYIQHSSDFFIVVQRSDYLVWPLTDDTDGSEKVLVEVHLFLHEKKL